MFGAMRLQPSFNRVVSMKNLAFSIHLFTASGAILALFAMIAAAQGDWKVMFAWLGVALIVDGLDGPLARKFNVGANAPRWDGVMLDLIIDYLTYVFIPAYALVYSSLVPGWLGTACAALIAGTGVIYFVDTGMKNKDNTFRGFPGCWNMVVLVLFALTPPVWVTVPAIILITCTCFLPIHFIHPVRTLRWRKFSLFMFLIWFLLAVWAGWQQFQIGPVSKAGMIISSLYLISAGAIMQIFPKGQIRKSF